MPNRIVREGILSSERIDRLRGWGSECFYRRVLSIVDDFGRFYGNTALIRSACYPLKIDSVRHDDIEDWLADCVEAKLLSTYEHEGKRYLQVIDFRQQLRSAKSKFPDPPGTTTSKCAADAKQMKSNAHLDVDGVVFGVVSVDGGGGDIPRKKGKRQPSTPLPPNFAISDRVEAWAKERGYDRLPERLEQFVGYVRRSGKTYVDWDEALMSAIREDWAKLTKGKINGHGNARDTSRKRTIKGLTGFDPDAIEGVSTRTD